MSKIPYDVRFPLTVNLQSANTRDKEPQVKRHLGTPPLKKRCPTNGMPDRCPQRHNDTMRGPRAMIIVASWSGYGSTSRFALTHTELAAQGEILETAIDPSVHRLISSLNQACTRQNWATTCGLRQIMVRAVTYRASAPTTLNAARRTHCPPVTNYVNTASRSHCTHRPPACSHCCMFAVANTRRCTPGSMWTRAGYQPRSGGVLILPAREPTCILFLRRPAATRWCSAWARLAKGCLLGKPAQPKGLTARAQKGEQAQPG